jgi:hypothetical protein
MLPAYRISVPLQLKSVQVFYFTLRVQDQLTRIKMGKEHIACSGLQINPDKGIANNKPAVDRVTAVLVVFKSLIISSDAPRREAEDTLAQTVHQPAKDVMALLCHNGVA